MSPVSKVAPKSKAQAEGEAAVRKRRLPAGARERAPKVVERLRLEYRRGAHGADFGSPWQLLVSVILSAQTTDVNVNCGHARPVCAYPTVADACGGSTREMSRRSSTGPGSSAPRRARFVEMSQDLVLRHGGEVPSRMEDLVQLRGVGRKTANVVLGVAFGVPGLAVDTHVARLTRPAPPHVRDRSGEDRGGRLQHRPAERNGPA